MNETSQTDVDLQVVDLGDAKEVTMGVPKPNLHEENPAIPGQFS